MRSSLLFSFTRAGLVVFLISVLPGCQNDLKNTNNDIRVERAYVNSAVKGQIEVTNNFDKATTITLKTACNCISFLKNQFLLQPKESQDIPFYFIPPKKNALSTYKSAVYIMYDDGQFVHQQKKELLANISDAITVSDMPLNLIASRNLFDTKATLRSKHGKLIITHIESPAYLASSVRQVDDNTVTVDLKLKQVDQKVIRTEMLKIRVMNESLNEEMFLTVFINNNTLLTSENMIYFTKPTAQMTAHRYDYNTFSLSNVKVEPNTLNYSTSPTKNNEILLLFSVANNKRKEAINGTITLKGNNANEEVVLPFHVPMP